MQTLTLFDCNRQRRRRLPLSSSPRCRSTGVDRRGRLCDEITPLAVRVDRKMPWADAVLLIDQRRRLKVDELSIGLVDGKRRYG
jgi:hypothetical protein